MELVEGQDLSEIIARGPMPLDDAPDHTRVLYFTPDGALMIQNIVTLKSPRIDVTLPLPPDLDFNIVAAPDGRTLYYGAQQVEANIWKVAQPTAVKR